MNEITFFLFAIKKNLKSNSELRASFLLNIFGMMLNNVSFIVLWVFFSQIAGGIGGWTTYDVIGLIGFASLSFGIVFSIGGGLRNLPDYTTSGSLDGFLLAPKNIILRIAASSLDTSAIGDFIFGLICLCSYIYLTSATVIQLLLIIFFVCVTSLLFLSMIILISSVAFLFNDAGTLSQSLFEIFSTPALFHGGAFQGALRFVFIFIIPSLLLAALPIEAIKSVSVTTSLFIFTITLFWFFLSIFLFYQAIKKYSSTNFITFSGS